MFPLIGLKFAGTIASSDDIVHVYVPDQHPLIVLCWHLMAFDVFIVVFRYHCACPSYGVSSVHVPDLYPLSFLSCPTAVASNGRVPYLYPLIFLWFPMMFSLMFPLISFGVFFDVLWCFLWCPLICHWISLMFSLRFSLMWGIYIRLNV